MGDDGCRLCPGSGDFRGAVRRGRGFDRRGDPNWLAVDRCPGRLPRGRARAGARARPGGGGGSPSDAAAAGERGLALRLPRMGLRRELRRGAGTRGGDGRDRLRRLPHLRRLPSFGLSAGRCRDRRDLRPGARRVALSRAWRDDAERAVRARGGASPLGACPRANRDCGSGDAEPRRVGSLLRRDGAVRISSYGISIVPPSGWDAHLYSRPLVEPSALPPGVGAPFARRASAEGGAATLHAGNFALPADNGEFGTEATSSMPPDGVFLALVEYQTGQGLEPGRGRFAPRRVPVPLGPSDFHPATLLRA